MFANWDHLYNTLGEEAFIAVRHGDGRKLDTFRDAHATVKITRDIYDKLDRVTLEDDPFETLPEHCQGSIFIATVGGIEYLVNTEGFSYCRYIAKAEMV
jgi:hypothetical protein